jgi:predicted DNA-binding transcriptional regulator YafY
MTARAMAEEFGVSERTVQRIFAQPRDQYIAEHSISRSKPWLALGISRATWYRRRGKPTAPIEQANP